MADEEIVLLVEPAPGANKQCPKCKFWTCSLPNGLVPQHPLPFGNGDVCPGESIFKPVLVKKPEGS